MVNTAGIVDCVAEKCRIAEIASNKSNGEFGQMVDVCVSAREDDDFFPARRKNLG